MSGNYSFEDGSTVSWSADYRNSPTLETRNALQGQSVSSLDGLRQIFTEEEIYDLDARVVQHELDHLDGILYRQDMLVALLVDEIQQRGHGG